MKILLLMLMSLTVYGDARTDALQVRFNNLRERAYIYRQVVGQESNPEVAFKMKFLKERTPVEAENLMLAMEAKRVEMDAKEVEVRKEKEERKAEIAEIKEMVKDLKDVPIPDEVKKILKRLVKELRK